MSTRLIGGSVSPTAESNANQELIQAVEQWRQRDLSTVPRLKSPTHYRYKLRTDREELALQRRYARICDKAGKGVISNLEGSIYENEGS